MEDLLYGYRIFQSSKYFGLMFILMWAPSGQTGGEFSEEKEEINEI